MLKFAKQILFLIILVFTFIVVYLGNFNAPFFGDEGYFYLPTIIKLNEIGFNLKPGVIDAELTRGHPLLVQNLAALWINMFNNLQMGIHSFAFLISILLIISIYYVVSELFGISEAIIAVVLLCMQSIFVVQSTLLQLEVPLTLCTIWVIYFYFKKRILNYTIIGVVMVLVKETGLIIIFSLFLHQLLNYKSYSSKIELLKEITWCSLPALVALLYFIYQYTITGWLFFPEHIGNFELSQNVFYDKLKNYFSLVFIYYNRNFLAIAALVIIAYLGYKRKLNFSQQQQKTIKTLSLIVLTYLVFCASNFMASRYIFVLCVLYIVFISMILVKVLAHNRMYFIILVIVYIPLQLRSFAKHRPPNDISFGYYDDIEVGKQMVKFVEDSLNKKSIIYSDYSERLYLSEHYFGYLSHETRYSTTKYIDSCDVAIIKCYKTKNDALVNEILKRNRWSLLKTVTFNTISYKIIGDESVKL